MSDSQSPAAVYAARLAARKATEAALRARLDQLSLARLVTFLAGLVVAALGFAAQLISPYFTAVPVVVFFWLVARYEMTRGRLAWATRAIRFYTAGLDRLSGKPGGGSDGARFADDTHPYAADLDLFGPGSVFERLSACRTRTGEDTLAAWLKAPVDPPEVAARQAAVRDLTPRLDLRESLAVAGGAVPGGADYAALAEWGAAPPDQPPSWQWWAVEILGWGNVLAWVGWLAVGTTALPVLVFGAPSLILAAVLGEWSRRVLAPVEKAEQNLSLLETVLERFEREQVTAPRLRELQAAMRAAGLTASAQIRELRKLVEWLNARRNGAFIPIAILRLWGIRYAFKLEAWRARSGPLIRQWLRAVGEAEALSSLAGYAYENPADVFPDVRGGPVRFEAVGLGHPLLPTVGCVWNDLRLGGEDGPRALLVSGSNMSGKSTLLRAVGVNAVLALAGGVVRATGLTLTPVALGATMRVQDSLQAGRSRFFAEVTKIRQLLDIAAANNPPLLFLLDEVFSGTNSADRVAGAVGVIRALLDAGAIGLVTTHDLALTAVTDQLGGRVVNVHFSDGLAGGELCFDYTMRPGVVPHGNGLALMRAVGLKV
ncbi:MAG: mutS 1 [Gemmataceae bacterium]|nr:mutS 1 [Gemmataceae bacterium]